MKINIVTKRDGWILERIAQGLQDNVRSATISEEPRNSADVNFYLPYSKFREKSNTLDVALFTHKRDDRQGWATSWDNAAKMCDAAVAMSNYTAGFLPPEKTTVIQPGIDAQFYSHAPMFGVIGSSGYRYRKGIDILGQIREIEGANILFTDGKYDFEEMRSVYDRCDYIIVLSRQEGGPMCVPEAVAMHKPIIAPDVGWCWEYPCIRYSNVDELEAIIKKIIEASSPERISYKKMADELVTLFKKLQQ